MLELIGLAGVLIVGGLVIGCLVLAFKLVILVVKLALLPVKLALALAFGLAGFVVVGALLLVAAPVILLVLIGLAIPVLILGGLVWGAVALVT
jgi:hypothetical protein